MIGVIGFFVGGDIGLFRIGRIYINKTTILTFDNFKFSGISLKTGNFVKRLWLVTFAKLTGYRY